MRRGATLVIYKRENKDGDEKMKIIYIKKDNDENNEVRHVYIKQQ